MKHLALAFGALVALATSCQPSTELHSLTGASPSVSAISPTGSFVYRRGTRLFDGDHIYRALGSNRFDLVAGQLATACQRDTNSDSLRSRQIGTLMQLRQAGGTVARLWAFQSMTGPNGDDFSHLDSLIDVAHDIGISLILVLENHYAECTATDTPMRGLDWYQGGFSRPYGGYRLGFDAYVSKIVRRYANEPAIVMWQIINEAQAPGHPEAVRDFLAHMAGIIRQHDRTHLICGGGALNCDAADGVKEYEIMAQVPELDVLDVHDFGEERVPWTTCLAKAKEVADRRQMSLMVGESGISGDAKVPERRAYLMRRKISAAAAQGVGIYLMWSLNTSPQYKDSFDILKGDPAMDALRQQATETFGMNEEVIVEEPVYTSDEDWWEEASSNGSWDAWEPVPLTTKQAQAIIRANAEATTSPVSTRLHR